MTGVRRPGVQEGGRGVDGLPEPTAERDISPDGEEPYLASAALGLLK